MAIPTFDDLLLPCFISLKRLGGEGTVREIEYKTAEILGLLPEDLRIIHRGNRTKLSYNLAWARNYLKRYGAIENPERGLWRITDPFIEVNDIDKYQLLSEVKEKIKDDSSEIEKEVDDEIDFIETEIDNPQVEKVDDSSHILKPFDPTQIKISTKQDSLSNLLDRIRSEEINLFTDFQRKGDLWDLTKQSKLIESILLKFPLPAFYFDATDDNKWLIVDGLQRISTFKNFIIDGKFKGESFRLQGLDFLEDFNGCTYDQLPRELKRRINETSITQYLIEPGTPHLVKYILFRRINTGGLTLEAQEIRHAINQGTPAILVKELADCEEFKKATCYSIRTERMLDRDFTTRFISFYITRYQDYEPDLDSFLNEGMAKIKELMAKEGEKWKKTAITDFKRSMTAAYEIFGINAFRKIYHSGERRRPINKALFETMSVCLAKLHPKDLQQLIDNKDRFKEALMSKFRSDDYYDAAFSSGTGDRQRVIKRFQETEGIIDLIINS